MNLLKILRNKETHFFIDEEFLSFSEFNDLRSLMNDIYNYLEQTMFLGFFGIPFETDRNYLKTFTYTSLPGKSYKDLVLNSITNKDILEQLGNYDPDIPHGIAIEYCHPEDIY